MMFLRVDVWCELIRFAADLSEFQVATILSACFDVPGNILVSLVDMLSDAQSVENID